MTVRLLDDRRRELLFLRPPRRIVSLVPSDTFNVQVLGAGDRLVGRTRYCEAEGDVAVIGGTKDVDVDAVAQLEPDLILANQEENSRPHLEELARRGLPVYVGFPRTVVEGLGHLARLARILGAPAGEELVRAGYRAAERAKEEAAKGPRLRVFVPIWMEPLMTINGATFIADALRLCGADNVFDDRARRYPLQADVGSAIPSPAGDRDTRYPRVTPEEVVRRAPEAILLPDEPHPFSEADAAVFRALEVPAARAGKVVLCGGRDLCWPGARSVEGIPRLRALVESLR